MDPLIGMPVSVESLNFSDTITEYPYVVEFQQYGLDLQFGLLGEEAYPTLWGNGEYVNDPLPLLDAITFTPRSIEDFDPLTNFAPDPDYDPIAETNASLSSML